jgi:hypothetical protein
MQARDIQRARRSLAFSTVPALYTHHVHSRNKYLSRLGIRPHGGPRLQVCAYVCSRMLTYAHASVRTAARASRYAPTYADVC